MLEVETEIWNCPGFFTFSQLIYQLSLSRKTLKKSLVLNSHSFISHHDNFFVISKTFISPLTNNLSFASQYMERLTTSASFLTKVAVLCRSGEARLQFVHSLNLPQILHCLRSNVLILTQK